jgi:crotonobetainyl-CoA:carnitine CoA-transferase CaiB-like acyl-CoA transferase
VNNTTKLIEDQDCRPAAGLRVIDLSVGMAPALVVRMLADAGAQITRISPPSGDPFFEIYPAYEHWKSHAALAELNDLPALAAAADVCIIGGEDFPDLDWSHDAQRISRENSRLIVVEIGTLHGGPAVDILVQARLGLVTEQLSDRPVYIAARTPTYGAALAAQLGLWAALIERESSGRGQIVSTTMEQGAAMFWSQIWMDATHPSADFDKLPPRDVAHLIFRCADAGWIQFVLGVPGALGKTYGVLGIEGASPTDRGMPSLANGPANYFADRPTLASAIAGWKRDDLVAALRNAGIAAEPVLMPGEAWSDPQVLHCELIRQCNDGKSVVGAPMVLRSSVGAPRPKLQSEGPSTQGPLAGLRIIDFGNFIAGPFASKLLADLGADVVKIEPPTGLANLTGLRNTWSSNRGKRSIIVDMKTPAGAEVIRRLCARADVAHHNFRLGVAKRLHVDPQELRNLRPDIVTLETSGYGSSGPKACEPGWDMVIQALCGLEMRAGGEGNAPLWYRSAVVDYATGALGAIAMLMAIFQRHRCAGPVAAEVSLLASALFMLSELVRCADGSFVGAPLLNSQQTGFHPAEQLYATSDGWIAIAARSDRAAADLVRVLGLEAFPPRAEWGSVQEHAIAARLATRSLIDAANAMSRAGIWSQKCETQGWQRLRQDPRARERYLVIEVADSTFGTITGCFGPPVNFSRSEPNPTSFRSAPSPGAHTREIVSEIGLSERADELFALGAIA